MLEAFDVFLNSILVFLLKHIFIKCLKHIIKAFISTYPTLAVIATCVLSVSASSPHVEHLFCVDGKIFLGLVAAAVIDTTFACLILIKCNKDN